MLHDGTTQEMCLWAASSSAGGTRLISDGGGRAAQEGCGQTWPCPTEAHVCCRHALVLPQRLMAMCRKAWIKRAAFSTGPGLALAELPWASAGLGVSSSGLPEKQLLLPAPGSLLIVCGSVLI